MTATVFYLDIGTFQARHNLNKLFDSSWISSNSQQLVTLRQSLYNGCDSQQRSLLMCGSSNGTSVQSVLCVKYALLGLTRLIVMYYIVVYIVYCVYYTSNGPNDTDARHIQLLQITSRDPIAISDRKYFKFSLCKLYTINVLLLLTLSREPQRI